MKTRPPKELSPLLRRFELNLWWLVSGLRSSDLTIQFFAQEEISEAASQVRIEHFYRIRRVYFKQRSRYIINGLLTCDFVLQALTQGSKAPVTDRGDAAPSNEDGNGGAGEDGDGGAGEHGDGDGGAAEDTASDSGEEISGQQAKKKRNLPAGSNKEAHALVKRCMPLWMGDQIGPSMGEGISDRRRNELIDEAINRFKMTQYSKIDDSLRNRLKACAVNADKVRIALLRVRFAFHAP